MNDNDAGADVVMTEETDVTEITIQPDGRVYVFGASLGVLEALDAINPHDARVRAVLAQLGRLETAREGKAPAEPNRVRTTRLGGSLALPPDDPTLTIRVDH
ncbi:MAG TPA: hypothetical protein VGI81_24435 [Tepidisphaeraceae bacterium]|jgi:hypothetical protein